MRVVGVPKIEGPVNERVGIPNDPKLAEPVLPFPVPLLSRELFHR
jgi:hypothetical protein